MTTICTKKIALKQKVEQKKYKVSILSFSKTYCKKSRSKRDGKEGKYTDFGLLDWITEMEKQSPAMFGP